MPEIKDDRPHWHDQGFLTDLDDWTIGVLITYLTDADRGRRTLTPTAPDLIADRLLDRPSPIRCEPHTAGTGRPEDDASNQPESHLRPGIFDDTPVRERQPIAAEHLRLLRTVAPVTDQRYLAFSTGGGGAEVLPPPVIEKRLATGWRGAIVAGASDLPASLINPWIKEIGSRPEGGQSIWPDRTRDTPDERFGEELGLADGARATAWLRHKDDGLERDLRCLAPARGAADLRSLDGGHDREGRRLTVTSAVWHGLLVAGRRLDLNFDWCSKCDGFAVRRLTDGQLCYYRAAHRLHNLARTLGPNRSAPDGTDWEALETQLSDLSDWRRIGEKCGDAPESWKWLEIVRNLQHRLATFRRRTP
ncbi:hypothetical protein AB5L52_09845 [Streptomyces sp. CG4]|uniref:hypothetical protein n=1 Tax=Streptomyces sp. CG4 TaxID=408783 RepID=UPI0034E202F4